MPNNYKYYTNPLSAKTLKENTKCEAIEFVQSKMTFDVIGSYYNQNHVNYCDL